MRDLLRPLAVAKPEVQPLGVLRQICRAGRQPLHLPVHLHPRADGVAVRFRAAQREHDGLARRFRTRSGTREPAGPCRLFRTMIEVAVAIDIGEREGAAVFGACRCPLTPEKS